MAIAARRHAEDTFEMPVEMALIGKADGGSHIRQGKARNDQIPGPAHPQLGEIGVGRHAPRRCR